MNTNKIKDLLLLILILCVGFQMIQMRSFERRIKMLTEQISIVTSNASSMESRLSANFENEIDNLRKEMKKEASLFADSDISVSLSGADIVVSMKAVPKEIAVDETLIFRLETEDGFVEYEADKNYQAEARLPMTSSIEIVALFQSNRGIRQESFERLDTAGLFNVDLNSIWGSDAETLEPKHGYTVWLEPNWQQHLLPFDPVDVAKAEFVIHNSGIQELNDDNAAVTSAWAQSTAPATPVDSNRLMEDVSYVFAEDFGERMEAIMIEGSNQKRAGYYVELAEAIESRKDGMRYEVYFCITTKDGARYATPSHSVATFAELGKNASFGSGDGMMYPVF